MRFQTEIPRNGTKNIFTEKETINKVLLMFFEVKAVTKR